MDEKRFNHIIKLIDIGDQSAFEELYNEYAKRITVLAYSILKDSGFAQDVLQSVMIKIWQKSSAIKRVKNPDAYIYTLTKNIAIDYYRINSKRYKNEISLEEINIASPIDEQSKLIFFSLIEVLDDDEKEIVIMKLVFNYTHFQISEEMKLPEGTVRWKYKVAIDKIRKYIDINKK